ncbi:transcription antitermination protein NusB [Flavobacteriales bacterium]|nr:transcription antitermination protein NusB [Flavobacteriales bacterium]
MLNRRHLRIKVLQALYAYYRSDGKDFSAGETELFFGINKIYELYIFYLLLFGEVRSFAQYRIEENKKKKLPSKLDLNPNLKFVNNFVFSLISENKELQKVANNQKINWIGEQDLVKKLYYQIIEDDLYTQYMAEESSSQEDDKTFALRIFKKVIANYELIHNFFEEKSIYWNDDIDFTCSMVLKTIKTFHSESDATSPILSLYKDESDEKEFARVLFRKSVMNDKSNLDIIQKFSQNWEIERIALMDILLMKIALTEAQEFETIPLKVTLNEYIDISKFYSTPKSNGFINGILDKAFEDLKNSGAIKKVGRGLI